VPLEIKPLSPAIGAEIKAIDLAHVSEAAFVEIIAAWRQHLVLIFRDQPIGDEGLLAFAQRFGDLDPAPPLDSGISHAPGFPDIAVVSNVVENGVAIGGLGNGELTWHSDMTFQAEPPVGCLLQALETPLGTGFTWFTSLRAAYETLPAELRGKVEGRNLLHDKSYTSAGTLRDGVSPSTDPAARPGGRHPFIWHHPSWNEDLLLLGRRRNAYVFDLAEAESETLLDAVWAHATQPAFSYRHEWRPGDVVLWDNLLTMHRRDVFESEARRVLHRAQIRRLRPELRIAA
jgi:taurine dioxygenase